MIRTDHEYTQAVRRYKENLIVLNDERASFIREGFTPDEVRRGLEPLESFQNQLREEITWYVNVRRGYIQPAKYFTDTGRLLIALRIYRGLSQKELAERLGVSEAQVSRDERNEYHGITMNRAQRIIDALNAAVTTTVTLEQQHSDGAITESESVVCKYVQEQYPCEKDRRHVTSSSLCRATNEWKVLEAVSATNSYV